MRFSSLGSGSRGNSTLVESGATCVMVDCGFSALEAGKRLARLNKSPADITAILVTHEHTDHIGGVARFSNKHDIPVWATAGTLSTKQGASINNAQCINSHQSFVVGDLEVQPFPVPHDAREPCQFVFSDASARLGILTDLGSITGHVVETLNGVDAMLLECNHDTAMLADGPYPMHLKERVGGEYGHLSNHQAADLLARLDTSRLRLLVAAHLSDKNNRPQLARQAVSSVLDGGVTEIRIACQDTGFDWHTIQTV